MQRIARALGADDAAGGIYDLVVAVGAKTGLKDIGMKAQDLDEAAEIATREPYSNPAPVTLNGVRKLLEDAYYGRRPATSINMKKETFD
jgi:maleylacetate reductase